MRCGECRRLAHVRYSLRLCALTSSWRYSVTAMGPVRSGAEGTNSNVRACGPGSSERFGDRRRDSGQELRLRGGAALPGVDAPEFEKRRAAGPALSEDHRRHIVDAVAGGRHRQEGCPPMRGELTGKCATKHRRWNVRCGRKRHPSLCRPPWRRGSGRHHGREGRPRCVAPPRRSCSRSALGA